MAIHCNGDTRPRHPTLHSRLHLQPLLLAPIRLPPNSIHHCQPLPELLPATQARPPPPLADPNPLRPSLPERHHHHDDVLLGLALLIDDCLLSRTPQQQKSPLHQKLPTTGMAEAPRHRHAPNRRVLNRFPDPVRLRDSAGPLNAMPCVQEEWASSKEIIYQRRPCDELWEEVDTD